MGKTNFSVKSTIQSLAYSLFADKLPEYKSLRTALVKTGISESYEMFVSVMFFISIVLSIISFFIALFLHSIILNISLILAILPSSIASLLVLGTTMAYWIGYPLVLKKTKESEINSKLHFILGYASIISSSTNDIVQIFKDLASIEKSKAIKSVYNLFLKYVIVGGKSVTDALKETAKRCPSDKLAQILITMSSIYATTGNLKDYLEREMKDLMQLRISKLKRLISQLGILAEIYVGLVILGPLILIIIISMMAGVTQGPLAINPENLMYIITLIGVPMLSLLFLILLIGIIGKQE